MSKDGVQATNYEWRVTRWKHLARGGKGRATEVFGLHWNVRVVAGTKSRVTAEDSNLFMERTGGKKVQLFRKPAIFFSAKGWKAAFSFISEAREKSIDSSIAEIMKTSSGEGLSRE